MRLGGDEFVVALHHPHRFEISAVEQLLRDATGPVDIGIGELVELDFSLGLAEAFGPIDVGDLLKAADLATYEDKRARAGTPPAEDQSGSDRWLDLTNR